MIRVLVTPDPIDMAAELAAVEAPGAGAVATFTGLVRADAGTGGVGADGEGAVELLELEHYPGATEAALERLAREAADRWSLLAATVVHRVGPMRPGERIVLVATAAPHRGDALDACHFLIDQLKTAAPFWKRETRAGQTRWVNARHTDDQAAARWT